MNASENGVIKKTYWCFNKPLVSIELFAYD